MPIEIIPLPLQILRQQLHLSTLASIDALVRDRVPPTQRHLLRFIIPASKPATKPLIIPPQITISHAHRRTAHLIADEDGGVGVRIAVFDHDKARKFAVALVDGDGGGGGVVVDLGGGVAVGGEEGGRVGGTYSINWHIACEAVNVFELTNWHVFNVEILETRVTIDHVRSEVERIALVIENTAWSDWILVPARANRRLWFAIRIRGADLAAAC